MHFRNIILSAFAIAAVKASPLSERQDPLPKADCCSCDTSVPGYVCKVPDPSGCVITPVACPFNPETQEQCCCCDAFTPAIRCKAIAKGAGCICPAVECPFEWDLSYLPISV